MVKLAVNARRRRLAAAPLKAVADFTTVWLQTRFLSWPFSTNLGRA